MDSKRQNMFSRLIQRDLGEILQQKSQDWFGGAFITVTSVRVSPDLGVASIYLSFMLVKNKQIVLDNIQQHTKAIRQILANRIRHQARVVPSLRFYMDDTQEVNAQIDEIFKNLHIPPAEKK